MEYKDYYKILGVTKNADEKAIKSAYRKLARQYHPDRNPDNKVAEDKFKEINEAYEVLGNPDNRSKYDQLGANYHRYKQMGGNPGDFDFSQWMNQASGQQVNFDFGDLGDLFGGGGGNSSFFESIFGGAQRQGGFGGRQQQANLDVEQTVEISLEEAHQGTTRTFSQNGDRFTAKIPAGADSGMKIRLRGKGTQSPYGVGDLFLVVKVKPHATYERKKSNLRTEVSVDVLTAVLGGKITVPTMTGNVKLTVPAGTQGGQAFRLKGRGMPHVKHKDQFGDLVATVSISIPKQLSDEERELYRQLAQLAHPDAE